jgi:3-oxoadipate enol-lactonase
MIRLERTVHHEGSKKHEDHEEQFVSTKSLRVLRYSSCLRDRPSLEVRFSELRLTSVVWFIAITVAAGRPEAAATGSGIADVNGTHLYYQTMGRGRPVVLVHGGLVDSRQWDDQMGPLARQFRAVRYDLRGYGRSAAPTGPFSPIEDLRALLDFLKIERATIVGLSLGGMIAADFALEYPGRTDRLVLVGTGLRGDTQPPDEKSLNAYRVGAREGADRYFDAFLQADLLAGVRHRPAARERMRLMMTENFKALAYLAPGTLLYPATPTIERLGDIRAPTLVMIGSLDSPILKNIADTIASKVPSARKVTIEGASHHPPVETPQEFNRALLKFLR